MGLIITENYLKQNSIVNDNTDMKIITPTIVLVQDKYIHPMLGSDLFNEIQSQIDASTPGTKDQVSTANQTLLDDYVLPCMLWYVLCECTPVFKYRYMNKGIMVKNSENSSSVDLQEIQFLMDKWKDNAEMYAERCKRFLYQEAVTYPKFYLNPNIDDIKPNKTNYTAGFHLDNPDDDCCFRYRT
jgi:hypothetical protein